MRNHYYQTTIKILTWNILLFQEERNEIRTKLVLALFANTTIELAMMDLQLTDVFHMVHNRELKQPRRRRQQKPHKFAYLTMKNRIFARFARAYFIFWHFEDVLVLSTTWNDLFCCCVDDVSRWWQMFNFVFLCPKRWFQFNSRIVRTHFSSKMTLNNCEIIAETGSYIFRWRSRFRRRRVCLSSLIWSLSKRERENVIWKCNRNHFSIIQSHFAWKICSNYPGIKLEPALGT